MGSWKPLLPWGRSTILETVLENVAAAGLEAIVVTGYRGDELHRLLEGRAGVRIVDNPDWAAGMAGSVLRGASSVLGRAFFVLPADMPRVTASVFAAMLVAYHRGDGHETLFAACDGRLGHPVLIPTSLVPALRKLLPEQGLRSFLISGAHRLVETKDPAIAEDLDTIEDYRTAHEALTQRESSPPP
jgi:molybdenum cofactor cytidylyltransferase